MIKQTNNQTNMLFQRFEAILEYLEQLKRVIKVIHTYTVKQLVILGKSRITEKKLYKRKISSYSSMVTKTSINNYSLLIFSFYNQSIAFGDPTINMMNLKNIKVEMTKIARYKSEKDNSGGMGVDMHSFVLQEQLSRAIVVVSLRLASFILAKMSL